MAPSTFLCCISARLQAGCRGLHPADYGSGMGFLKPEGGGPSVLRIHGTWVNHKCSFGHRDKEATWREPSCETLPKGPDTSRALKPRISIPGTLNQNAKRGQERIRLAKDPIPEKSLQCPLAYRGSEARVRTS